uniref:Uncharacterized protein n=1 Tax=viral metagenome TaxID=1070528 RepID=A0A6C0I6W4_9ZZZZ
MTTLYNNKNYIFSIFIKVLYLFIFLSCFFYIIVEKQVTNHLADNISNMLSDTYNKNVKGDDIKKYNMLFNYYTGSNLNDISQLEDKTMRYNNLIYTLNVTFIIFLVIIPIIIYYVATFVFNKKIPIVQILIFNVILYILVGAIEYMFFIHIASKYIPVTDGDIINEIKNYFLK